MSELTYEAIVAEINKTVKYKPMDNPYIYRYADIQIAIETAMQVEREHIIKLLEKNVGQNGLISVDFAKWLIEGENK